MLVSTREVDIELWVSVTTLRILRRVGHGRFAQGIDMNYELCLKDEYIFILHEEVREMKGEKKQKKIASARKRERNHNTFSPCIQNKNNKVFGV